MTMTEPLNQKASDYFSPDYATARARFLTAARKAGGALTAHPHPLKGPGGEDLSMDVARIGPIHAEKVLSIISGTHGIEGYCGSAIQTALLEGGLADGLPADTALVFIHALNPHGFAWGRRVNEDNIDLNRNFVDFNAPLPSNEDYALLHDALLPDEWTQATQTALLESILDFVKTRGQQAYVDAVSTGQYTYPKGLFFGGHGPSWSNKTVRAIFETELAPARALAFFDIHTGLGERGMGELLSTVAPDSPSFALAQQWLGADIRSTQAGTSVSADVKGSMKAALIDRLTQEPGRERQIMAVSIEYGTKPQSDVGAALMADNWLHMKGKGLDDPQAVAIKQAIRSVFLIEEDDWAGMVHEQAERHIRNALKGLASA